MSACFSAAAERNKEPVLKRLQPLLREAREVLEIGSGTGQHALHFATHMPWLRWHCSELPENLPSLNAALARTSLENLGEGLELDVRSEWPSQTFDGIYTANTLHIMSWDAVEKFFAGVQEALAPAGRLIVYGPFRYGGMPSSESNAGFDRMLRESGHGMGVRDIEAIESLAMAAHLRPLGDFMMPANNRLLAWEKCRE